MRDDLGNPLLVTIPAEERYQNLKAQEYPYDIASQATSWRGQPEAILELRFKNRLVPLFQFVACYNKDLEILPGHDAGRTRAHQWRPLPRRRCQPRYPGPGHHRWRPLTGTEERQCVPEQSRTHSRPLNPRALLPICTRRTKGTENSLNAWNGMIHIGVEQVVVPTPDTLNPQPGSSFWDKADLRVVLILNAGNTIEMRRQDNSVQIANLPAVGGCATAVKPSATFYNNREGTFIRMLDVDMRTLLNCVHTNSLLGGGKGLDDTSDGGLVFHFTVMGPNAGGFNNYGVRLFHGGTLQATIGAAEGAAGQDKGLSHGGLENYPRLHEQWANRTLTYRGSFVSLNPSQHVNGAWQCDNPQYTVPIRNWGFDTACNDSVRLPPLTPQFVYLRQELFVRQFERQAGSPSAGYQACSTGVGTR